MRNFNVVPVDRASAGLAATPEFDAVLEQRRSEPAEYEDDRDLRVDPHTAANHQHGPNDEHRDQPDGELLDCVGGQGAQHDGHYDRG